MKLGGSTQGQEEMLGKVRDERLGTVSAEELISQIQILSAHALIKVNFWERHFIIKGFSSSGVSTPSAQSWGWQNPRPRWLRGLALPGRRTSSMPKPLFSSSPPPSLGHYWQ